MREPPPPPPPEGLPAAWHELDARIARLDALIARLAPDDYALKQQAGDKLWALLLQLQQVIDAASGPAPCPRCSGTNAITPAQLGRPGEPRACVRHDRAVMQARHRLNGSTASGG